MIIRLFGPQKVSSRVVQLYSLNTVYIGTKFGFGCTYQGQVMHINATVYTAQLHNCTGTQIPISLRFCITLPASDSLAAPGDGTDAARDLAWCRNP